MISSYWQSMELPGDCLGCGARQALGAAQEARARGARPVERRSIVRDPEARVPQLYEALTNGKWQMLIVLF